LLIIQIKVSWNQVHTPLGHLLLYQECKHLQLTHLNASFVGTYKTNFFNNQKT